MTIPGVDEITAGAIIEEREGRTAGASAAGRPSAAIGASGKKAGEVSAATGLSQSGTGSARSGLATGVEEEDYSFKSEGDFMARIPGMDTGVSRYISVKSGTFRLVIEGEAAGITHAIQAIAEFDGKKTRYLQWREDP